MEKNVVNQEVKETSAPEPTQEAVKTEPTATPGEVVKETQKEKIDKVPYSRFSEVISQKNEAIKKYQELEAKYREIEARTKPQAQETDPFTGLSPEEREQTEKFIEKYVEPRVMKKIQPFIQDVQTEKINKQIESAKDFAKEVGINFDERLPEIVDYLSRPENKGRLTAEEALLSLYKKEIIEKTRLKAKEEISQETKDLMEKKRLANTQIPGVNPNVVIHSDEMARKSMTSHQRLEADIQGAIELARQGVKNPKVRV